MTDHELLGKLRGLQENAQEIRSEFASRQKEQARLQDGDKPSDIATTGMIGVASERIVEACYEISGAVYEVERFVMGK